MGPCRSPLQSHFQFAWFLLILIIAITIALILALIVGASMFSNQPGLLAIIVIVSLIIVVPSAILQVRIRYLDARG